MQENRVDLFKLSLKAAIEALCKFEERKDFRGAAYFINDLLLKFDSAPDYWAAVNSNGEVELAMCTDDGKDGKAARREVNSFIKQAAEYGDLLHLVGLIKIDQGDLK